MSKTGHLSSLTAIFAGCERERALTRAWAGGRTEKHQSGGAKKKNLRAAATEALTAPRTHGRKEGKKTTQREEKPITLCTAEASASLNKHEVRAPMIPRCQLPVYLHTYVLNTSEVNSVAQEGIPLTRFTYPPNETNAAREGSRDTRVYTYLPPIFISITSPPSPLPTYPVRTRMMP